jgi:CO dehydrogenase nickel-insertion accessory protein CooC1
MGDMELAGHITFSDGIMEADIRGASPFSFSPKTVEEVRKIKTEIEKTLDAGR